MSAAGRIAGSWRGLAGHALLAMALCASPVPVVAGGAHTVSVGATVLSKNQCRFTNAGPTTLAFGAIDPSSTANSTASATTTFRCVGSSPMATYVISSDDGLFETGAGSPRMQHGTNPARYLPYTINLPQSGTVPKNVVQTLTLSGTVLVSDFQNALAGTYTDTVILTIAP